MALFICPFLNFYQMGITGPVCGIESVPGPQLKKSEISVVGHVGVVPPGSPFGGMARAYAGPLGDMGTSVYEF